MNDVIADSRGDRMDSAQAVQLLSIIIPCFNEEEVIVETFRRMEQFCRELKGNMNVELIFVDDGSKDSTWEILQSFKPAMAHELKLIRFSRNFGHQTAVTAGIDAAMGDAVVLIDADLQDPPEIIHQMIEKWREGYQVVYGTRVEREGESFFKLLTARLFYRFINRLSEVPIPLDTGDFRLIDKKAADVLRSMPEKARFVRGMVTWVGFNQIAVPYKRHKRFAGVTKYPLRKMVKFATDGIISFSSKPLYLAISLGLGASLLSFFVILYALALRFFTNTWITGWTAIMVAVLFIGGIQLLCIGILGSYQGRIYNEVKNRPLYVIRQTETRKRVGDEK